MKRLRWPKERHLLKSSEFKACYDSGEKYFSKLFVLFAYRRQDSENFRLGLTVSKKHGHAVARNRIKRVVRECVRLNQNAFEGSLDLVVIPKKTLNYQSLDLSTATKEIIPLMHRAFDAMGGGDVHVRK